MWYCGFLSEKTERTSSLPPYLGHKKSAGERVKPLSGMHLDHIEGCLNLWSFRGSTETSERR